MRLGKDKTKSFEIFFEKQIHFWNQFVSLENKSAF